MEALYGFEMREPDLRRKEDNSRFNIKQLWNRSHEILGLVLQGFDQKVVAQMLGISVDCVSETVNSDLGRQKLSEMRKKRDEGFIDVSKKVAELAEKALKVYEDIFDNRTQDVSMSLRKETADTVLMDLGGHRAPTKIDNRHLGIHASLEEIEEFKQRGLKAARESGILIEVKNESPQTAE
jgi:predicted transcriptional regulator